MEYCSLKDALSGIPQRKFLSPLMGTTVIHSFNNLPGIEA